MKLFVGTALVGCIVVLLVAKINWFWSHQDIWSVGVEFVEVVVPEQLPLPRQDSHYECPQQPAATLDFHLPTTAISRGRSSSKQNLTGRMHKGRWNYLERLYRQAQTNETEALRFSRFDPACSPVLSHQQKLVKVGFVTSGTQLTGEEKHILVPGLMGSSVLEFVGTVFLDSNETTTAVTPTDADVWVVNGQKLSPSASPFLQQLFTDNHPHWKVLIVDFSDRYDGGRIVRTRQNIRDQSHVRIALRSIVEQRHFAQNNNNPTDPLMQKGVIAPNIPTGGGWLLHCPYAVRWDLLQGLLQQQHPPLSPSSPSSSSSTLVDHLEQGIFSKNNHRTMDVLHLWEINHKGNNPRISKLRNAVSHWLESSWNTTTTGYKTSTQLQGQRGDPGREHVDDRYVTALQTTKMVIVTQRDPWEDHYRLMEALACGPLVLADAMVAPPRGLVHNETIVFFDTLDQLQELVEYYLRHEQERLAIAKRGWKLAMREHLPWHRMEQLLLGRTITTTTNPFHLDSVIGQRARLPWDTRHNYHQSS